LETQAVISVLADMEPQTGGELLEKTGMDPLALWQCCRRTPAISCQCIGKRYLRLDKNVQGFARLSPSIRREFLTYTVIGLEAQRAAIEAKAQSLLDATLKVTCSKKQIAQEAMQSIVQSLPEWPSMEDRVCFLIAGDIVYDMAHAVPRPEVSTGKMVRGSDLDIIVVAEDDVPKNMLKVLDAAILKKKYYLLVHPNYQEEIDYLVKDIARVREQLAFDTFQHMIAGKILHESAFLYGSALVFEKIKRMVDEFGVAQKLDALEKIAEEDRRQAESSLLKLDAESVDASMLHLFYTREEGDEIY
jgi:hypothetical protein